MTPTSESRPHVAAAVIRGVIARARKPADVVNGRWKDVAMLLGVRLEESARTLEGVAEELESAPDLSAELAATDCEYAALKAEVLALREALQQARDTRPNENYKVVTIELEIVDVLLGAKS